MQAFKRLRSSFPGFDTLVDVIEATVVQSAASGSNCIVTHNGTFHCDEALACGLLKVLPQFSALQVCRTRDKALIEQGFIVVDVGATFDVDTRRFDHHQNSFTETFYGGEDGGADRKIKLSSAGLVYKYYGKDIIRALCPTLPADVLPVLYKKLYDGFVEEIDGVDNGVELFTGGTRNYRISSGLSSRVGNLQVSKAQATGLSPVDQEHEQNERFKEATVLTTTEFCEQLQYLVEEWLPARIVVQAALKNVKQVHASGEILRLDTSVPWKGHLVDLERETGVFGHTKFCLFSDGAGWRVQTIPTEEGGFDMRIPLKWKGLRDDELSTASGISGCVFVHASGFIGGNKTYEGALAMAVASLLQ
ncbi:hypothetical protein BASA81_001127 [Batrachochytrium salamandrivorans]|nr:hypothetical protein BASA81_001127 [Batrachochytrium salamandrivorans]